MLATVASQTSANRLKRYAEHMGRRAYVVQTPLALSREGCGYSVRFEDGFKNELSNFARKNRINIRGFFCETEKNGEKKYIRED